MDLNFKRAFKTLETVVEKEFNGEKYKFTVRNLNGVEWLNAKTLQGAEFYAALLRDGVVEPKLTEVQIEEMIAYALPLADAVGAAIVGLKREEAKARDLTVEQAEKN